MKRYTCAIEILPSMTSTLDSVIARHLIILSGHFVLPLVTADQIVYILTITKLMIMIVRITNDGRYDGDYDYDYNVVWTRS